MDERNLESIRRHLQDQRVQEQIRKNIERGRSEASVRIGWAAQLFDFKDSQLREWESRGLLNPSRSKDTATGQRQYSLDELDKLAIIRELIDAKFSPSEIPPEIDELWEAVNSQNVHEHAASESEPEYIDQRIQRSYYKEAFWRFYVSHALRLSLLLICEDSSFTRAGLILPLERKKIFTAELSTDELPALGESLVGWLGQSRSFYTFLTHAPDFEYRTDFRLFRLMTAEDDAPVDNTLIAVPRMEADSRSPALTTQVVDTVRRLLEPLYKEVPDWHFYLGRGMRDILDPLIDFNGGRNLPDIILTGFAQLVVRMGGKKVDDEDNWHFCCIMVPNNLHLPFQQRSLILRAKSRNAPGEYKIGTTIVVPDASIMSVSLRAYQGGHIVNRHKVSPEDTSIAHRELEEPIGSAIAVPVGGEEGLPVAILYIVSAEGDAFSEQDMCLLRMVGRMIEELLMTYEARTRAVQKFVGLIRNPQLVDLTFRGFASEAEFIYDVERQLAVIKDMKDVEAISDTARNYTTENALSFIAFDIDNQTSLTNKYGTLMAKNLSRAFGLQIQKQIQVLFTRHTKLYHIYADRFYLLLKGVSLEKAREKAALLKKSLNGSYQVDALRSTIESPPLPENLLVSSDITVRLGVASYTYVKLQEVMLRYPPETSLASTSARIARFLDEALSLGQSEGGNVIISWDPEIWGMVKWPPLEG